MPRYLVTVQETVHITFTVEADDPWEAEAEAELAAIEESFPKDANQRCERTVKAELRP